MTTSEMVDVAPETVHQLEWVLMQLADDLGDGFQLDAKTLDHALFGSVPSCHGALALEADRTVAGGVLFSPVMSTTDGASGVYVTDLWVAKSKRGQALGPRLLAHAARGARGMWQARFMRLVSYGSNKRARAVYDRLGFVENHDETVLQIGGVAFEQLMD